jgi:hypothetical protein
LKFALGDKIYSAEPSDYPQALAMFQNQFPALGQTPARTASLLGGEIWNFRSPTIYSSL